MRATTETQDADGRVTERRFYLDGQEVDQATFDAPEPDYEADFRAALTAATTVTQLREALLGKAGPGAEPRRPDGR